MAYAMGTVTSGTPTSNGVTLNWTAASGGTGPYSYKVYRSTATGFTPGAGNLIATLGVGVLTYTDSGLIPNTTYYYVVQSVDTGNANATANSAQASVLTAPYSQPMNQFAMAPYIGQLDQAYNTNTRAVMIAPSVTTTLYAGQAVKYTNPTTAENTVPAVVPVTSASDPVCGFIQYSLKDASFTGGMMCAISQNENVQYLMATANGSIGDYVECDLATVGGVKTGTTSDGNTVVAQAIDQPVAGQLARYRIMVPNKLSTF